MSLISMILFLHPGCLREMKFSGNTVKKRSNAEQKEGSKPASNFVATQKNLYRANLIKHMSVMLSYSESL